MANNVNRGNEGNRVKTNMVGDRQGGMLGDLMWSVCPAILVFHPSR